MTAATARRDWLAACAACAIQPGPARDAAEVRASDLRRVWLEAVDAEAKALCHQMILPQGLFPMHTATPRA